MHLLFDYMVNGIDTVRDFEFEVTKNFEESLVEYLKSCFKNSELSLKECSMNPKNYFLCINEDEYKEVFGFEIKENNIFFLEGIYSPQDLSECVDLIDLLSHLIKFCADYEEPDQAEEESEEESDEWI